MSRFHCPPLVAILFVALAVGSARPPETHAQGQRSANLSRNPSGVGLDHAPSHSPAGIAAAWQASGDATEAQQPAPWTMDRTGKARVSFRTELQSVESRPSPRGGHSAGPNVPLLPSDWQPAAPRSSRAAARPGIENRSSTRSSDPATDTDPDVNAWPAFDGGESSWLPADPALAVGPDHVVGAVNANFNVFDKQGKSQTGPIALASWYQPVLSAWGKAFMVSAPVLAYDNDDDRFVMAAVANDRESQQSVIAFAVTQTEDPTGDWCLYALDPALTGNERLPLMASTTTLGFNRDALYFTADLYEAVDNSQYSALNFDHARAFFLSKSIYYQPDCAPSESQVWYRFAGLQDAEGQPARALRAAPNLDGTGVAYLAGTNRTGGDAVTLWRATTQAGGAPVSGNLTMTAVDVEPFSAPPAAEQPNTAERIDAGDASPASAVQVDDSVWLAHSVACDNGSTSCHQWYQIDPSRRNVLRSERWGLTVGSAYYPSLMPDGAGEPVLIQNFSSAGNPVSIRYGDGAEHGYAFDPGAVGRGDACFDDSRGAGPSLWGFRNSVALDPETGTVWAHAAVTTGSATDCTQNDWRTVIMEVDWPTRPGTLPTPTIPTPVIPTPTAVPPSATPPPTVPVPTAVPPPAPWSIGMPVVANRVFHGQYQGNGEWVDRLASISGRAISGIQVQNLDGNRVLDATASYYAQRDPYEADRSKAPARNDVELKGVPAGGSANMYLPNVNLPTGQFSLAVRSNNDLLTAAIARTDWSTGGAALYSNVDFDERIIVPLAVRNYVGQTSIITVMAAGNDESLRARLDFYAAGSSQPINGPTFDLAPHESLMFDLNDAVAAFERLGDGFVGSAVIQTTGGQVGAVSYIYSEWSPTAVSAFEGVAASSASNTLFAPLFRANQRGIGGVGRLDTGISVVNPLDHAVDVVLTYYPTDSLAASSSCRSQREYQNGPLTIPANSSHVFYQGPDGDHGLPDDCFGSAVIQTMDPADEILAIVNDSTNITELTAAYNALPANQAHTKVALPLFRNRHLPQELTTGIQVMNAGDETARVEISFTTSEGAHISGCGSDCVAEIEPHRSFTWYPPTMAAIPAGIYGSAVVKSDEPILVIVNDYPLGTTGVDAAIYNGIPVFDHGIGADVDADAEPR
jgi:hypothetical protein